MNLKKEIVHLVIEILFCIITIIFGYYIWNKFDKSSLEIAKSYDNINEIEISIDDTKIVLSNNEDDVETNTLYLHNISEKNNDAKLLLKIDRTNVLFKNNTVLKINNKYYNLEELEYIKDSNYLYIIINNYKFQGYETKELNVKILTKEKVDNNIGEYFNYEFLAKV